MKVNKKAVAKKLIAYLHHQLTLEQLVDWAENVMQEGDFEEADYETLREIVARLGVADVKSFGLTWEDCESFLNKLGYQIQLEVTSKS